MRRIILSTFLISLIFLISSCNPTPADLADESIELHKELAEAKTEKDSSEIFRKISALESEARRIFRKEELKEYERLRSRK